MSMRRRHLLAAALALPAIRTGAARAGAAEAKTVRIGVQKGEPILMAVRQNQELEKLLAPLGYDVQWIEFQFGPPVMEAMRVGSVDLGAVGDTPPLFAQAAHGDLLYVSALRSGAQAILLPPGSQIKSLADLKGKKLAFGRASSAHYFAIKALERVGLRYDQAETIYLAPADAGAAFERGAIDAWCIWDPYRALFENRPGVRTLVTSEDLGEQNSFIIGRGAFVRANPELTAKLLARLTAASEWVRGHRQEVAELISNATGMPPDVMRRAMARVPAEVLPMTDDIIRSQQQIADHFRELGLLPVDIRVSDAVWRAGV
jgi:sulfonate transport system substrate-binding protein